LKKQIAVLLGSLRRDSYSRKLGLALARMAPESLDLEIVEIGGLPLYNQDLEAETPAWATFRARIAKSDGVLFVTPEYNRSIPAVLKNAIDVGSRPPGKSAWDGKPGAIISLSQGGLGGFGANHHLRQSLVFVNVPAMQQPEAYIGNVASIFDAAGEISAPSTREFIAKFLNAFAAWVERNARQR